MMLFLLFAATCLGAFLFTSIRLPYERPSFISRPGIPPYESHRHLQPAKNERFFYPYSVIPGGVQSREELAERISRDSVIANHYFHFEVEKATIIKSEEDRLMYVSYRMRDQVFWTAKKIRIPQGELLITDGCETARARCGNRVSAVPEEPVSEEEPVFETFEIPVLARMEQPSVESTPDTAFGMLELPPLTPYYRPLFFVQPADVVVPEPAPLSLLSVGLFSLFAVRSAQKK